MSDISPYRRYEPGRAAMSGGQPAGLADVLDRILDKGLVIAGDISISLAQVELITIKIRLLLASADKAREMGIDWWTRDPMLSGAAGALAAGGRDGQDLSELGSGELADQNRALLARVDELEERLRGVLSQPESTAASPTAVNIADLIKPEKTSAGARRTGGPSRGGGTTGDAGTERKQDDDLEGRTLAELRELATKRDIAGRSSMKKDELIRALRSDREA